MKRKFNKFYWEDFFSKESGVRHVVMLGISILLAAWTYVALSLIDDWDWVTKIFTNADSGWEAFSEIGLALGLTACFGVLVYWCFRTWFLDFLFKAFLGLFGWLPFVRRLDPEFQTTDRGMKIRMRKLNRKLRKAPKDDPRREIWASEYVRLKEKLMFSGFDRKAQAEADEREAREQARREAREDRREVNRRMWLNPGDSYFDVKGEVEAERGAEKMAGCLLAPFSFLWAILLRILTSLGYILASVGVPVLTPALILILASLISMACRNDAVITSIVAIVLLVIGALIMIVHPIIAFIHDKRY